MPIVSHLPITVIGYHLMMTILLTVAGIFGVDIQINSLMKMVTYKIQSTIQVSETLRPLKWMEDMVLTTMVPTLLLCNR